MALSNDLAHLGKLVAAQHGWPAAKAFKSYEMNEADSARLTTCALDILKIFPKLSSEMQNVSGQLSAALCVRLEKLLDAPIQVVAGELTVEGVPVFDQSKPHVWLMVGPYIVDVALFRIAYSAWGPAHLSRHVNLVFGQNKALYVDAWRRTKVVGLSYKPTRVLSAEDIDALMADAFETIRSSQD